MFRNFSIFMGPQMQIGATYCVFSSNFITKVFTLGLPAEYFPIFLGSKENIWGGQMGGQGKYLGGGQMTPMPPVEPPLFA